MSILLLISMISLITIFMLIKKNNKKLDFIKWLFLSIVLLICYNTFITWFMSLVCLPINLISLVGFNLFLSLLGYLFILRKKGVQKYYFDKSELVIILIVMVFASFIFIRRFGFPFSIKYEAIDSGIHFLSMKLFSNNSTLLTSLDSSVPYYNSIEGQTIYYVNAGLFLKSFSSFINVNDCYVVFILFEGLMYTFSAGLFVVSIFSFCKTNLHKALLAIVCVIYILGYPLNSMIFGFEYLTLTIIVINGLLVLLEILDEEYFESSLGTKILYMVVSMLLLFGIFMGYYLFAPFTFLTFFIWISYKFYKHNLLFKKEYFIFVLVVFFLPGICGLTYMVLPRILKNSAKTNNNSQSGSNALGFISNEGYLYRNLYADFILLSPFLLYAWFKSFKQKLNYLFIAYIVFFLLLAVFFILTMKEIFSTYYYYKNYNVLWLLLLFSTAYSFTTFKNIEKGFLSLSILIVYLLGLAGLKIKFDERIIGGNNLINPFPSIETNYKIFSINFNYNINPIFIIDNEKAKVIQQTKELVLDQQDDCIFVEGSEQEKFWYYDLTGINCSAGKNKLKYIINGPAFMNFKDFDSLDCKVYYNFKPLNQIDVKIDLDKYTLYDYKKYGFALVKK